MPGNLGSEPTFTAIHRHNHRNRLIHRLLINFIQYGDAVEGVTVANAKMIGLQAFGDIQKLSNDESHNYRSPIAWKCGVRRRRLAKIGYGVDLYRDCRIGELGDLNQRARGKVACEEILTGSPNLLTPADVGNVDRNLHQV